MKPLTHLSLASKQYQKFSHIPMSLMNAKIMHKVSKCCVLVHISALHSYRIL